MILLLLAALLATAGCANTGRAIDEFRATNEKANAAIAEIRVTLATIADVQREPSEMIAALGEVLTLTEGISTVVAAGAEVAQKIKDAEYEDLKRAALAGGQAAAGALIGPELASQLFAVGSLTLAGFATRRAQREGKGRGKAEARASAAEAKNGGAT